MRLTFFAAFLLSGCAQDPILKALEDPAWCPTTTEEVDTVRLWQKEEVCNWLVGCSSGQSNFESCMQYEAPTVTSACRIDGCALRRCYEGWDPETASCQMRPPDACNEIYVQECD